VRMPKKKKVPDEDPDYDPQSIKRKRKPPSKKPRRRSSSQYPIPGSAPPVTIRLPEKKKCKGFSSSYIDALRIADQFGIIELNSSVKNKLFDSDKCGKEIRGGVHDHCWKCRDFKKQLKKSLRFF
jgi:hypothetical protein